MPEELITEDRRARPVRLLDPRAYGGTEMGLLTMCVLTEELSAASLVAGSLITRSEILTRALIQGGTEEQRQHWLPRIACRRADRRDLRDGAGHRERRRVGAVPRDAAASWTRREGWFIEGPKAWSTFAGRANILALLARTDPDTSSGARGLSLFIVEKEPFDGHSFVQTQGGGGSITGTANPTPGYRGMHSFTLAIDRYFVPEENLVGREDGLGQGVLPADGRVRGRTTADGGPRDRRRPGLARESLQLRARPASSSASRSPSTSSRSTRSAAWRRTSRLAGT